MVFMTNNANDHSNATNSASNNASNNVAKTDSIVLSAPNPSINEQVITPAKIEWQRDDSGNKVPVSGEFGDVYFSHADGLAESRYVFINGNQLTERLANLTGQQSFTIVELGFGTALNLLAVWQLWRQLRITQPQLADARLHFITTEMHPLSLDDLTKILSLWAQRAPELADLIEQLLATYPMLVAGAHRLTFPADNLTVDIWLGDAATSLAKLQNRTASNRAAHVDAWLLDGFAPSCNESLWADAVFAQIQRLSQLGTSVATYSCAGVVKRGLQNNGFALKKIKGFGRKNEMLTAVMTAESLSANGASGEIMSSTLEQSTTTAIESPIEKTNGHQTALGNPSHSLVIGAGVAGLSTAWSLANRGIEVTLLDKTAPLAGASGNPRALLAPKMTPIHHVDEHLHTLGYLYSCRFYQQLNEQAVQSSTALVLEPTGALDLLIKANVNVEQISAYPPKMATTLSVAQAQDATNLGLQALAENLYLPQSGLVNPQALKTLILDHPLITYQQLTVTAINETALQVCITGHSADTDYCKNACSDAAEKTIKKTITADNVIICAAFESHELDRRVFDCRKIRGQLSWFTPTAAQWAKLPKLPLKYSGYCAPFTPQRGDSSINNVDEGRQQLLLGASFVRNDISTEIRAAEHQVSRDKLIAAIPELAAVILTDTSGWQARAGVRTQTPDYHPILGQLGSGQSRIWTLSAMGAKGYAYAPLCAEILADIMLGNFVPVSTAMLARLSPQRSLLQTPLV